MFVTLFNSYFQLCEHSTDPCRGSSGPGGLQSESFSGENGGPEMAISGLEESLGRQTGAFFFLPLIAVELRHQVTSDFADFIDVHTLGPTCFGAHEPPLAFQPSNVPRLLPMHTFPDAFQWKKRERERFRE